MTQQKPWELQGCVICRRMWEIGEGLPELAANAERHARLTQCEACGAFWEEFERYAVEIPPADAQRYYPEYFQKMRGHNTS